MGLWVGHVCVVRTTNSNDYIVPSQMLLLLYIKGCMYINLFFFVISLKPKSKGKALYDNVYEQLNLEEREYFGLNFYDKSDNLVSTLYIRTSQGLPVITCRSTTYFSTQ